ncbi:hypothetical protein [Fulvimarina sp. MAC8]|uniref:hypothetical protein n=1 Tax=Fulvimarina sp. MAC8 TaxID=3162874 RepID=UPI0032EBB311
MDHQMLSAALQEAADAYAKNRRLASHLPIEAAEIDFIAINSGVSASGLKLRLKEENTRKTRVSRDELDPASLVLLASALSDTDRANLAKRIRREVFSLKRYARISDARYDLNRHAALVRLLAALEGNERDDPHSFPNVDPKPKRRSAEAKRLSKHKSFGPRRFCRTTEKAVPERRSQDADLTPQ